jgi:manganese/zinc/iron transport system permease protein
MLHSPWFYFSDAVLRAPTIGCMLMCFAAAMVGVIAFLKKQSLLGESLSHAAYPGVIVGVIATGTLSLTEDQEAGIAILVMTGAFLSALAGLWIINFMERKLHVRTDSALCFVLSAFFGIGLTLASQVQFAFSSLYRQAQVYLYGQAATMTDIHIVIYGALCLLVLIVVITLYKEIQTLAFDRDFAKSIGMPTKIIDIVIFLLIVLAVVIGIRSVGVVLMSAMLIAPAAAARQYTNKLYMMLILAAFFGLLSGFLGNYLSVEGTHFLELKYPTTHITLPTGPMIVVIASVICLFSLMFAPERGLLLRMIRVARFRYRCICENLLKAIWRFSFQQKEVSFEDIVKYQSASRVYLRFVLKRLKYRGYVEKLKTGNYRLTTKGELLAAQIVRLHRLWEVYLADYLGVGAERVHRSAEEMEHIITPELEQELTLLLEDPKLDPHHQPIPPKLVPEN